MEEYSKKAHIEADYLPKIQKWISRRKFTVDESGTNELKLSIDKTFDFNIKRSTKSDAEQIREELGEIKKEK